MPYQVQQASILALNRTAEWMKGKLAKDISAEQRLKLKLIRDRIVMQKANKRNPQAQLSCNFKSVYVKVDTVHADINIVQLEVEK